MEQKSDFAVPKTHPTAAQRESPAPCGFVGIGAVERDTGLTKDTLRVWERRYAFPKPGRDAFGERIYPREQVERLLAIKRLMDCGMRPGKIIHHNLQELNALCQARDTGLGRASLLPALAPYLEMVRSHRVEELRNALGQVVARSGLGSFVTDVVAPLNVAIGELWMQGVLEIFEEHLYTESVQVVLRNAIGNVPRISMAPRLLLTTLPQEQHGLGLLMAEAMLAIEGARCISLGVQTPVRDIVRAAASQQVDIVALSFSQAFPVAQAVDGMVELRGQLSAALAIWVGGGSAVLARRLPAGVLAIRGLADLKAAVGEWRLRAAQAGQGIPA